jgi:hypothetical protein
LFITHVKTVLPKIINVDQTGYAKIDLLVLILDKYKIDYADMYKIERAII